MTFNIAHGRGLSFYQGFHTSRGIRKNLDRIARIILETEPDVVAFQEIDESSHWNKHINQLDYLQSATGYPFAEHGIHNKRAGRKPLAYGNALLSRRPIRSCVAVPFGDKTLGEKGFMDAKIDFDGNLIDIINLHLDFRSRRTRIQQIELLLKKITRGISEGIYDSAPIICGDFNTGSRMFGDAVRQLVVRSATHHSYEFFPKKGRTFPAHLPSRGLDFALLAYPFFEVSTSVIRSYASDHLPVIVEFDFDPNRVAVPLAEEPSGAARLDQDSR